MEKISTTVYLNKETHLKARKFALEKGMSFTELVEKSLKKFMEGGRIVRKIISHKTPRHLDDFLAIAVLKAQHPEAEIEYVPPQNVPADYLIANDIAVIDVGGRYEPEKLNFDHHQNLDIPSSIILVLNHLTNIDTEKLLEIPFLLSIDFIDRQGINKAIEKKLVRENKEIDDVRNIILQTEITQPVADVVFTTTQKAIESMLSYEDFILLLSSALKETTEYRKAEEKIKEAEQKYQKIKEGIKQFVIDGATILCSTETVAPNVFRLFSETSGDILIERNSQNNNHTSVIVNTSKADLDRLYSIRDKLVEGEEIVFKHPNNFIVVVNSQPHQLIEKIISLSR